MNSKYRIAVIDDSEAIVDLSKSTISKRLNALGHQVEIDTFLKGKSFHTSLLDTEYDIALIDYDMPTMNGLETVNLVKSIQENTKFVFVVSRTFPDVLKALQTNEVFAVYVKNDLYFDNVTHLIADQIRLKYLERQHKTWKRVSQILGIVSLVLITILVLKYWIQ